MKIVDLGTRLFLGFALAFGMFSFVPPATAEASGDEAVAPPRCLDGNRQKCAESTSGSTTLYYYWV